MAIPATLVERYVVIREIGRGGMATVFLAEDRKHDRLVAIKVLLPELSAAIGAERFTREIRLLARLQHPHILPLFDSGDANELLFFVMPYIEGESLRQLLVREGNVSVSAATPLVRQIADALDYAHARDIVHRDLKPENVLLVGRQALLADFGIARGPASSGAATLTAVGTTLGTPEYMSPEQAAGDANVDARSDVYALACLVYEMLSGAPPFADGSAWQIISRQITAEPRPLGAADNVPPAAADAVMRALQKDPANRFASAGDFAAALEAALGTAPATVPGVAGTDTPPRGTPGRKTVLVLDFTNISGTPDVDWLSSGIAESVSVDLKRIGEIHVVGSDAATRKRVDAIGRTGPLSADRAIDAGRSLGARWVVWGGFQKSGDRIRLTPHFADTESENVTTADKIDGEMKDIFALQDRIVTNLADHLRIRLSSNERAEIERPETTHIGAYEYYARGLRAFQLFGKESAKVADEYFRKALELDPRYALAYAGLGSLLLPRYIASGRQSDLEEGVWALQRAMELDPGYGEPYAYLAYMYARQYRWDDAIAAARMAIQREPASHMGWYLLGVAHAARAVAAGDPPGLVPAMRAFLRARAINASFHPPMMAMGALYMLRGQYGHAATVIDEAVAIEEKNTGFIFLGSYVQRGLIFLNSGLPDAARAMFLRAVEAYPRIDHVYAEVMTAYAYNALGILEERLGNPDAALAWYRRAIDAAEAHEHRLAIGAHWVMGHCGVAQIICQRGDGKEAARLLDRARDVFRSRSRFVWGWILGASDADVHYAVASALASCNRESEAAEHLEAAASMCWSDAQQLNHDPAFRQLRESATIQRLLQRARDAVILPPPVGSGGLT